MGKKKHSLPFDKKGGTVVVQRRLLTSEAYLSLTAQSKALLQLMHVHWRNDKPVAYGIREAQDNIPCCRDKAMVCFGELQEKGFIVMVNESLFNSRTGSKSRTWRLTWLPYLDQPPTNEWERHSN